MNKDSYLILEALPADFDSRVKAMEARPRNPPASRPPTPHRTSLSCPLVRAHPARTSSQVDEKPVEEFNDVGGLDDQIQELARPPFHPILPRVHSTRATGHTVFAPLAG